MAGFKIKLNNKVPASTLIEVLVSMVCIIIVFSIAMGIYNNILRSSLSVKKYHAQSTLNQILNQIEKSPKVKNQTYIRNKLKIHQQVTLYNQQKGLFQVYVTVFDQNHEKLAEIKKIVYEP